MTVAALRLRNAERCERYARQCPLDQERRSFLAMAEDWRRLAAEAQSARPDEPPSFLDR